MQPIAKSVKRQVRSTESSHIVNTTIGLSHKAVERAECYRQTGKQKDIQTDRKTDRQRDIQTDRLTD